jgi:hypothetical protein
LRHTAVVDVKWTTADGLFGANNGLLGLP